MEFPLTRLLHQRCHKNPTSICLTLTLHGLISPIPIQDDVASMLTFRVFLPPKNEAIVQLGGQQVWDQLSSNGIMADGFTLHLNGVPWLRGKDIPMSRCWEKCVLRIGNLAWLFSCWNLESKSSQETSM